MKRPLPSIRNTVYVIFAVFLFSLLLVNADIAMDGVRRGLLLCSQTLIPSLFPFLVLSELLVASGAGITLGRLFSRPVAALFGVSRGGAVSLLLGAVCGFPVATTSAVALYRKQELSEKEVARISLFANNPSSGFLIGATGQALFGNRGAGAALFAITLLSAATVGIFLRILFGKVEENTNYIGNGAQKRLTATDFTGSVKCAFSALLAVCAFVIFFAAISACLTPLIERLSIPPLASVLLRGTLELTTGISTAVTTLSPLLAFRAAAFFSSFSGLCVALQIFSAAEGIHLSFSAYFLAKLCQGALSLLFADLYLLLCKPTLIIAESVEAMANATQGAVFFPLLPWAILGLLICMHLLQRKHYRIKKHKKERAG